MSPIRVGIIGLSGGAKTSWASRAHLPYLLPSPKSPNNGKYELIALCNSSVEAAQRAIKHYALPATTKAYGSPNDLAADAEVDLVVCATRVDLHYETTKPSIENGKDVFVEWPLCSNAEQAEELTSLARKSGSKTVVGLQGRLDPTYGKVKSLIKTEKRIGKVLSSNLIAYGGTNDRASIGPGLQYFLNRKVGGNMVTILYAHMIDSVHSTLGEWHDSHSKLQIQRPQNHILDPETKKPIETITSNVPDLISVHGSIQPSPMVDQGALLSVRLQRGVPLKDWPALVWEVMGETGAIRVVSHGGTAITAGVEHDLISFQIHDFKSGQVEDVEFPWDASVAELPLFARNMASLYEAYALGLKDRYASFEDAVFRHQEIDGMLKEFTKNHA